MQVAANHTESTVAIRTNLGAIFVSLELSRSKWLVTSVSPGTGEKMSKFNIRAGDIAALLARFGDLQRKGEARTGQCFGIISIQEAGLDGFWIHRVLEREGFESYIVDPASNPIGLCAPPPAVHARPLKCSRQSSEGSVRR
jgi:transposase